MIRFECDYTEGAHPKILELLAATNLDQMPGYGRDPHCERAVELIRAACEAPQAHVHFLVGGTQANATVISAFLKPYQGVISAPGGHINAHEAGAIEAFGHKVLSLPDKEGKLSAGDIREYCRNHWADASFDQIVQPGMVYLSHPTEYGTLYTRAELEAISVVCHEYNLALYVDGARLGYGLAAEGADVDLPLLAKLCDAFYIGGTKVGGLFGEAVVLPTQRIQKDFRYHMRQHGGLLAKGRLLGIQFEALLSDGLYWELGAHADRLAAKISAACKECGLPLLMESQTNQQFVILPDSALDALGNQFSFSVWERVDADHTAVRFCTSWATKPEAVDALCGALRAIGKGGTKV